VATRPEAQKRGYAEAVVRFALQRAHEATGLTRTTLHATDAGRPVYKRVGYYDTAKIMAYKLSQ
jgi:GNAT superfamily N-acetyltransferase